MTKVLVFQATSGCPNQPKFQNEPKSLEFCNAIYTVVRMPRTLLFTVSLAATLSSLNADFSYDQTSKITGGAMVSMMKMAGTFSKDARKANEPILSTTAVRGNRLIHKTADMTQIIDLDQQTITRIHTAGRTYSVITFDQMKQAMDDMSKKMQKSGNDAQGTPDVKYDVSIKDTGQTRMIAGNEAHERILTLTMKGSDAKSGAHGGLDMTTDMWIAPKVAGYDEIRAFYRRMSTKIAWTPTAPMGMGRPDMARAMQEFSKEGSKLEGMPVLQIVKMGGSMDGVPTDTETRPARQSPPPSSVSDAVGGAIAGRLGMGGLGRRKQKQDQPPPETSGTQDGQTGSVSGSLMEMTMEVTRFSRGPADPSLFEVPAGFSKVEEDAFPQTRRR